MSMELVSLILSVVILPAVLWLFSRDNLSGRWHAFSERANARLITAGKWVGAISVVQLGRRLAPALIVCGLAVLFGLHAYPIAADIGAMMFFGGILAAWLFWPLYSQVIYLGIIGLVLAYGLAGIALDAVGLIDLGKLWSGMPPSPLLPGLHPLMQIEGHGARLLAVLAYLFVALWIVIWVSAIFWVGSLALCLAGIVRVGRLLHTDWAPKPIVNLTSLVVVAAGITTVIAYIIRQLTTGD